MRERAGELEPARMHRRELRAYLVKSAIHKALDERKSAERRLTVRWTSKATTARTATSRSTSGRRARSTRRRSWSWSQSFPPAARRCWCFGCQRGGRIYDLASLMSAGPWGRALRGDAFRAARELAAAAMG
jgi:hypothetical protein